MSEERAPALALLGSGEFEPWTEPVDRWLLSRATGDGTVLVLPAASAPEGEAVFDRWATMGLEHYGSLGIPAEVIPIKTHEDADGDAFVSRLNDASVANFSGGNPAYLADVLSGSRFWTALVDAMGRGLAYSGCSAGVACLGEAALDSAARSFSDRELWRPGLRLFPNVYLGPHWDALDLFVPGLKDFIVAAVPSDGRLLAIDERTAVVGDGTNWSVMGSGSAHLYSSSAWLDAGPGETLSVRLLGPEPGSH